MPEAPTAPPPVKPMGFIESMVSHANQPGVPVPAPVIAAPPVVVPPAVPTPTAAPPAKPAAAPIADNLALPDFSATPKREDIADEPATSPRAKDWKAIKAERDDWMRKAKELEAKVATPAIDRTAEIEKLKKEHEELSTKLREVAVEKHPQFVAHFDAKRKDIIESVTRNVGENAQKIADLLALPNSADRNRMLDEAVSSMSPLQQAYVGNSVVQLDQIARERQAEIAKSSLNFEAIQQQQQQQADTRRSENEKLFNGVLSRAAESLAVFQTREGDEDWNRGVEQRKAVARNIAMGNIGPEGVFKAATWAAAAPGLLEQLNASRASEAALGERIKQLESASPNIRQTDHAKVESEGGKPLTFAESIVRKTFGK